MSGHSKWRQIKHKKAATDSQRSQQFGRLAREIAIAVRQGGNNPATNAALREAIARAKRANLPGENIARLLVAPPADMSHVLYEGFGPAGVAVLVVAATDNPNRTVAAIRAILKRHGGKLGMPHSITWKFSADHSALPAYQRRVDEQTRHALSALLTELNAHPDVTQVATDIANETG